MAFYDKKSHFGVIKVFVFGHIKCKIVQPILFHFQ